MSSTIQPVSSRERISSIDILRGFALLGILLVNVLGFNASFFYFGGYYGHLPDDFQQRFYNIFISLTADKFIFLFSFLFGYGIYMQYRRFSEKGADFIGFFARRMVILALFGIAHILLLWAGDILLLYAIAGFIAMHFVKASTKWQIVLALAFYFFIGIWLTAGVWIDLPDAMSSTCTECLEKAKTIYSNGNYFECLRLRLIEYAAFRYINLFYYLPKIIGLTLFGMIASKFNLHQRISNHPLQWTVVLGILILAGIIVYFNYNKVIDFSSPFANAVYMTGYELMNVFVASSYLLLILILASNKVVAGFLQPVALMGRASLTNYLLQSLILAVIFYGWGFGYFGQTNVVRLEWIAVAVYTFQLIINPFWFRFNKQGPLERLWRKLSYKEI